MPHTPAPRAPRTQLPVKSAGFSHDNDVLETPAFKENGRSFTRASLQLDPAQSLFFVEAAQPPE